MKTDPEIVPLMETPAQIVQQVVLSEQERLVSALRDALKATGVKFVEIPGEGVGIYKGQLYYKIKEIKSPIDFQTENQLMEPLLQQILGKEKVRLVKYDNKDYYCATKKDCEQALGKNIRIDSMKMQQNDDLFA